MTKEHYGENVTENELKRMHMRTVSNFLDDLDPKLYFQLCENDASDTEMKEELKAVLIHRNLFEYDKN